MIRRQPDNWIRCKGCGHKLMRLIDVGTARVEIKCHSCKEINIINLQMSKEKEV